MRKYILFLIKIILLLKTLKMDNLNSNSEIEKELLDFGFEKEQVDLALRLSSKKEEAIDL
jgi:hypothetical protein